MQNFGEIGGKRFYKNNHIIKYIENVNEFPKNINL